MAAETARASLRAAVKDVASVGAAERDSEQTKAEDRATVSVTDPATAREQATELMMGVDAVSAAATASEAVVAVVSAAA